ncbi:hypothetical protein [Gluconobacter sp.]|uniref:hypothetical protein n=1 Tax=Gluconobacter sp. TaxID=1876758 RepID=UPI0039E757C6
MTFLEDLLNDLPKLVERMRHHDVRHLSWNHDTGALALTIASSPCQTPQPTTAAAPAPVEDVPVLSPEMGVFRGNGMQEGQSVRPGDIIGFVETGVLRLPVTATADGTLGPALTEDGRPVGYHAVLFRLHPDG